MPDDSTEMLRLALLKVCDALEHQGKELAAIRHDVHNAPARFAVTVGQNTAAVTNLIKTIEDDRADTTAKLKTLEDEIRKVKHG